MSEGFLSWPGAVEADAPDVGVAAHYGSLSGEQRSFAAGQGFVDLSHRDVITITGTDRLTWLHSLTTQALEGLEPGVWTEALVLSPQGRVEYALTGIDDGEVFRAHTEPGQAEGLLAWLGSMVFMSRVELSNDTDQWAVIGLPDLSYHFVLRDQLSDVARQHGDPAGLWAWEAARIEAGRPRYDLDVDDKAIPNELGVLDTAVHMDKGCYRGQETVARVYNLGSPPRRLTRLLLDGSAERLPEVGAEIEFEGKAVGRVGSGARHHELGPIALALVKRKIPTDATLLVDGIAATQDVIVSPDTGLHARPKLGR